jgi:drug/metabolite transporter (DMT)-like permease
MTAVAPPALWVAWAKLNNVEMQVSREGIITSMLTGVFFSLVVVSLSLTFQSGGNLSVASPVIRLSALVLASFLGILILGEVVSGRWAFGVLLTFAGIYFIVTR